MSLFSQLASAALGALNNNSNAPGGQSGIAHILTDLVQNHSSGNGLAGLVQQLAASGLGPQVKSWVGTGANLPVSGEQIQQALGSEKIQQLAQQVGIDPAQIAGALAHLLPHAVDQLTPGGEVPPQGGLQGALSGLLNSGFFKG
ncbi:MAG: YidB family protein [Chthoniobacter sp.]|nr:YidB family protein [Chthoniobacter sp.]